MLLALALLAALAAVALALLARETPSDPARAASAPARAVIVRAQAHGLGAARGAVERAGGTVGRALPVVNGFLASLPAGAERAVGAADGVAAVVDDGVMGAWAEDGTQPADASTAGTSLDDVRDAIGAQQSGATGAGVDVAVIDTGMVPVPALAGSGKVVQGPDFSSQGPTATLAHLDTYGHGTHIAGIIAGSDPGSGFRGVAPDARLVNLKAAGADGSTTLSALVSAVGWAIAHRNDHGLHIRVLNLSFGTPPTRYQGDLLAYALEQAWKAGIVVVTSAGNDGDTRTGLTSPAYDPFLLAVGADDLAGTATVADDVVPSWSGRGDGVRNPDLVAPGRSIVSVRDANSALDLAHPEARVGDDRMKGSGTSQAAAVVSGAVALVLERRPDLSPDQVKALLRGSAAALTGAEADAQGSGRIDVAAALAGTPDPVTVRQTFPPARLNGLILHLLRGVSGRQQAEVEPVSPDGARWSGAKWGGSTWGGSRWGGSSWNGSRWGGSSWGGSRWGGSSWGGSRWGGSSWGDSSWSGSGGG
jgi:serine protease AprX